MVKGNFPEGLFKPNSIINTTIKKFYNSKIKIRVHKMTDFMFILLDLWVKYSSMDERNRQTTSKRVSLRSKRVQAFL